MMNQDLFKEEQHLQNKLDEYHIQIPDFPRKRSRFERFIHILASPAKDPFEQTIATINGVMLLKVAPAVIMVVIGLLQILLL
ncbi:hypothetical protein [Metabacillus fastidiosus]|uniref:hypothetical protein n=1 Tax=Metabacillus fastidiosus TaxID=1458 RepID=UPI003D2C64C6